MNRSMRSREPGHRRWPRATVRASGGERLKPRSPILDRGRRGIEGGNRVLDVVVVDRHQASQITLMRGTNDRHDCQSVLPWRGSGMGVNTCQRRIAYRRLVRSGSLLTDRAVDRFAEEVRMAGMTGGFFDKMQQHPPQREVSSVAQRRD